MRKSPSWGNFSNNKASSSPRKPFVEVKQRVRYSETDKMGVAHNKSYLEWFEIGRTEFCRHNRIPYKDIEAQGYYLVVVEAFCRYKKPLRYDQEFLIRVTLEEISSKKVVFRYELLSIQDESLVASGYTVHIVTNKESKVCSLPGRTLDRLKNPGG